MDTLVQGSQRVPPNPVTEVKLAQMIRLDHKMIAEHPSYHYDFYPGTTTNRVNEDGARRRALIVVLKPDPEALQRLSVPAKVGPGR